MSKVLDALRKRRHATATVDGETVYLRAMTLAEVRAQEKLQDIAKAGFAIGCCLTDADGTPAFPRTLEQTDEDYAAAVLEAIGDVPQDTLQRLSQEIGNVNSAGNEEAIRKNS